MKSKTLSLMITSFLALVMLANFASATVIFSDNFDDGDLGGWDITDWTNPGTYAESTDTADTILSNTISTDGYEVILVKYDRKLGADWENTDLFRVSWSIDGTNYNILEEVTGDSADAMPDDSDFVSKSFTLPSTADDNSNFELKFECTTNAATEFCQVENVSVEGTTIATTDEPSKIASCDVIGNPGNDLRIKNIDFTNNGMNSDSDSATTFGDDDAWFPLDDIEVEIELENNGDDDIDNVEVEWGLWDTKEGVWAIELDNEKDFDIKDDDSETITISFNLEDKLDIDLEDLNDGNNYKFYVFATGESQEYDQDVCANDFEDTEIVIESDFVVLSGVDYPNSVSCGDNMRVTGEVWNIGDRDQEDVSALIYNQDLDILQEVTIGDVNAFDSEKFDVLVNIPEDVEEGNYFLTVEIRDEDEDVFENDYDDDEAIFKLNFAIEGCTPAQSAAVTASLVSGGKAGQEMVIKAILTNTGEDLTTYNVNVASYTTLASGSNVEPQTVVLNSGESREITITFDVNSDAVGEQSFDIEVLSEGNLLVKQPVSVTVQEGGFGVFNFGEGNAYLWVIGILNVLLIVIIIIVAIRLAKK